MKKNVAILIPSLGGGGAERVASNLSLYLSNDQYNKYVIVYDDEYSDYPYEGKLISMNIKASANPIIKMINIFRRTAALKGIKKEYNIDTTISLLSGPNIINILSKTNDKVIVSVRNFISKSSKGLYGRIFSQSIKVLYNKADCIVAVSEALKEDLMSNYRVDKNKTKVIYNFYDVEKIMNLSKECIEDCNVNIFENPVIITVGRISKQKGHKHLIRAFTEVKKVYEDVKLIILGKGELEGDLRKLIEQCELVDDVHLLGFKNNPYKYIAKSKVFVLSSLYEGFPNALCEAMACGIPVISTDCKSGPVEILCPTKSVNTTFEKYEKVEFGILTPVFSDKDSEEIDDLTTEELELSASIIELLNSADLSQRYSKKSLDRVNSLGVSSVIREWEKII